MALIMGGFLAIILIIVIVFYLLKLFSFTVLQIPGINNLYSVLILLVPYIVYYCCYYYLLKKIGKTNSLLARGFGMVFLSIGILVATATMVLSFMVFFKYNAYWLRTYETNGHYAFIAQILFLFATSISIASGDKKEKDWMSRGGN
jgi:hypothetical protein